MKKKPASIKFFILHIMVLKIWHIGPENFWAIFLAQTVINLLKTWCCCFYSLAIFSIKSPSIVDRHGFLLTAQTDHHIVCSTHSISYPM